MNVRFSCGRRILSFSACCGARFLIIIIPLLLLPGCQPTPLVVRAQTSRSHPIDPAVLFE